VAQVNSGKWDTHEARVYALGDAGAVSKGADLLKAVNAVVFDALRGRPQLKKFAAKDFALTLQNVRIITRGGAPILQLEVLGQVPKNEDEAAVFDATVTFALQPGEAGAAPALKWTSTNLN
jgi:hypothetical protein